MVTPLDFALRLEVRITLLPRLRYWALYYNVGYFPLTFSSKCMV